MICNYLSLSENIIDFFDFIQFYLLLINRAQGPHWENIARGLSGTDRAK